MRLSTKRFLHPGHGGRSRVALPPLVLAFSVVVLLVPGAQAAVEDPSPEPRTTWAGFLVGSWVVNQSGSWNAGGEPSVNKQMLVGSGEDGTADLQDFHHVGEAWVQSDHGSIESAAVVIVGRHAWRPTGRAPTTVVDVRGAFQTTPDSGWTMAEKGGDSRDVDGRTLTTRTVRWSCTRPDGTYALEITHADGVVLPQRILLLGRHVANVMLPADAVAFRSEENENGQPARLTAGRVTTWSRPIAVGAARIATTVWSDLRGSDEASLEPYAETCLSAEVPGHSVSHRHRRADGSWRSIDLLYFHRQDGYGAGGITMGPWQGRKTGAWIEAEERHGAIPIKGASRDDLVGQPVASVRRVRVALLGGCDDGFPALERAVVSGADAGRTTVRLAIPPRPFMDQAPTQTAIEPAPATAGLYAGAQLVTYRMVAGVQSQWDLSVLHRDGLKLPCRETASWFAQGTLPEDAYGVEAVMGGQHLVYMTKEVEVKRRIGADEVSGIVSEERVTSPSYVRLRTTFRSAAVPGLEVLSDRIEVQRETATRDVTEVVGFGTGP